MHADGAAQVLDILVSEANRENLGSVYFDTILCSSTKEALAVAESRGKDVQLVLLDVLMAPGEESGDMAVPALRSALPPGVAIVMISATQEMSLVMRCIAMGADTFLPKPLPRFFMRYLWMFWLQSAPALIALLRAPLLTADPPLTRRREPPRGDALRPAAQTTRRRGQRMGRGPERRHRVARPRRRHDQCAVAVGVAGARRGTRGRPARARAARDGRRLSSELSFSVRPSFSRVYTRPEDSACL